jgi:hypothetical protein
MGRDFLVAVQMTETLLMPRWAVIYQSHWNFLKDLMYRTLFCEGRHITSHKARNQVSVLTMVVCDVHQSKLIEALRACPYSYGH